MLKKDNVSKRLFLVIAGLFLLSSLFADISFYGLIRTGAWAYKTDDNKISYTGNLYSSSRFGLKYFSDDFKTKIEFGYKKNNFMYLRLAYAEYSFNKFSILLGKYYTGFSAANYSSQVASFFTGSELANIGIGAFYDESKPMFKITYDKKFYLILMQPSFPIFKLGPFLLFDPNTSFPKLNLGYNFISENLSVYYTLGFNYIPKNYDDINDDDDDDINNDDYINEFAVATTLIFKHNNLEIKSQINYGKDICDYGILNFLPNDIIKKGYEENSFCHVSEAYGGFFQFGYKINTKKIISGIGYTKEKGPTINGSASYWDIFSQINFTIKKNLTCTPEIGFILLNDDSLTTKKYSYLGSRLQFAF